MNSKPSINDFVEHRWADAKEELRKLDRDFIRRVEETMRVQNLGLEALGVGRSPRIGLPKEWNRLLEDCYELVMQATVLKTAIDCFIDDSRRGLSSIDVGRRFDYHMHSWFIHANTLAERTQSVIGKTTRLYISDCHAANKIAKRYCISVYNQVTKEVAEIRNQVGHGTTRSWVQAVTRDNLWEPPVAAGMTPRVSLDSFLYPERGQAATSGRYDVYVDNTKNVLDHLGVILRELEEDIATHNVQVNFRATRRNG